MSPIIEHPDVARMLVTMKALTQGSRAICYVCAHATDMSHHAEGDEARHWAERAALLTPIAKSFATDAGVDVASLGIQTHGGMGFIEETGAARFWRDSRIAPIYEGTNGIQAADLVTRKLPLSNGNHVRGYITELKQVVNAVRASNLEGFGETAARLDASLSDLEDTTEWLLSQLAAGNASAALSGATPYQRLFGLALTGVYLAKGARRRRRPRPRQPPGPLPLRRRKPDRRDRSPQGPRHQRRGKPQCSQGTVCISSPPPP